MLPSLLLLLASAADAADLPLPVRATAPEASGAAPTSGDPGVEATARRQRNVEVELSFRSRYMIAPRSLITAFGFEDDKPDYAWPLRPDSAYCADRPGDVADPARACGKRRPRTDGISYGLETLLKWPARGDSMIVYVDWVQPRMTHGYWDDREEGENPDDPTDGDYLAPGRNFGLLMVGVNYQADVPLVRLEKTRNAFGLDFTAGAGLGLIVMTGRLDRWIATRDFASYELFDLGEAPNADKDIGRFWPAVDINLGLKFNFGDRVVLRVEGGLHTLIYGGATLGFKF